MAQREAAAAQHGLRLFPPIRDKEVPVEVIKEVTKEVPVEVIKEVEVEKKEGVHVQA